MDIFKQPVDEVGQRRVPQLVGKVGFEVAVTRDEILNGFGTPIEIEGVAFVERFHSGRELVHMEIE